METELTNRIDLMGNGPFLVIGFDVAIIFSFRETNEEMNKAIEISIKWYWIIEKNKKKTKKKLTGMVEVSEHPKDR